MRDVRPGPRPPSPYCRPYPCPYCTLTPPPPYCCPDPCPYFTLPLLGPPSRTFIPEECLIARRIRTLAIEKVRTQTCSSAPHYRSPDASFDRTNAASPPHRLACPSPHGTHDPWRRTFNPPPCWSPALPSTADPAAPWSQHSRAYLHHLIKAHEPARLPPHAACRRVLLAPSPCYGLGSSACSTA